MASQFYNPENILECLTTLQRKQQLTTSLSESLTMYILEYVTTSRLQSSGRKQQLTTFLSMSLQVDFSLQGGSNN